MDDATRQGIFGAVVQLPDAAAVESLLADFEEGADQKLRLEIFDGEADGMRGLGKAPIAERLTPRHPPARGIQLGRGIVIKVGHRTAFRHRFPKSRLNIAPFGVERNSAPHISTKYNNSTRAAGIISKTRQAGGLPSWTYGFVHCKMPTRSMGATR